MCVISSSFWNYRVDDLVIPASLHFVYCLVAIVPGIQLFVSGMVVDTAVAGVALREEHHRALIAACAWQGKVGKVQLRSLSFFS